MSNAGACCWRSGYENILRFREPVNPQYGGFRRAGKVYNLWKGISCRYLHWSSQLMNQIIMPLVSVRHRVVADTARKKRKKPKNNKREERSHSRNGKIVEKQIVKQTLHQQLDQIPFDHPEPIIFPLPTPDAPFVYQNKPDSMARTP
jgi:hypothetical protein